MFSKKIVVVIGLILLSVVAFWQFNGSDDPVMPEYDEAELASMAFRQQILHASDLVAGMATAVKNDDQAAIEQWQQKTVEVAKAAELTDSDITFISSDKGREYLVFHAKRALFNEAFEQHYYQLKGIDALKNKYPEARDLFAEADRLIAARDAIIMDIARELSDTETPGEADIKQAKAMWQERFRQSAETSVTKDE
jgi:hypothetical protein